jgi:hypothetical protein
MVMEDNIEEIQLTEEEIAAARAIQREEAFNGTITKGWVWNEEKIAYVPPINPPDTTYPYLWNEETESWDEFPGYPRDDE